MMSTSPTRLSGSRILLPFLLGWPLACGLAQAQAPNTIRIEVKPGGAGGVVIEQNAPAAGLAAAAPAADGVPWLGVQMELKSQTQYDEDEAPPPGIGVLEAVAGSPAAKAGILPNDRILKLGEKEIQDENDLRTTVRANKPGVELEVEILRKEERKKLKITLEAMPEAQKLGGFGLSSRLNQKLDFVQFNQPAAVAKPAAASPDSVVLMDGNRLVGKILSMDATDVKMKLDSGHDIVLDATQVLSARAGQAFTGQPPTTAVQLTTGGTLDAVSLTLQEGVYQATLGPNITTSLPAALVSAIQHDPEARSVYYSSTPSDQSWSAQPAKSWILEEGVWKGNGRSSTLSKKFPRLSDAVEFSFDLPVTAQQPLPQVGVSLFSQRLTANDFSGGPGMIVLDLGPFGLTVSQYDGMLYANSIPPEGGQPVVIPPLAADKKSRRLAVCAHRTLGLLHVYLDGFTLGSYKLTKVRPEDFASGLPGRVLRIRSTQGELSVANILVRNWPEPLPPVERPGIGQPIVSHHKDAASFQPSGLQAITAGELQFAERSALPVGRPWQINFPTAPLAKQPAPCWIELVNGSAFPVQNVSLQGETVTLEMPSQANWQLPVNFLRQVQFPTRSAAAAPANLHVVTMHDGRTLRGRCTPSTDPATYSLTISAARSPILMNAAEVAAVLLHTGAAPAEKPQDPSQVLRLINGDWFPMEMLSLTKETLKLSAPFLQNLELSTSNLASLFPGSSARHVADTASGWTPWKATTSGINQNQIAEPVDIPEESPSQSWAYHDGAYRQTGSAEPTPQRGQTLFLVNGVVQGSASTSSLRVPVPELKQPMLMEFDVDCPDAWFSMQLRTGKGEDVLGMNYSMGSLTLTRSMRSIQRNARDVFRRPQQFVFSLPNLDDLRRNFTRQATKISLHLGFDVRQQKLHVGMNGQMLGSCDFQESFPWQEIKSLQLGRESWGSAVAGKLALGNLWISPWLGQLPSAATSAETPPPDGQVQVQLGNGDSSAGVLTANNGQTLQLDCEVGEIPLPASRIMAASWPANAAKTAELAKSFPHSLRLIPRGKLSFSTVKWQENHIVATTPWGEFTLEAAQVKEIVWRKG